MAGRDPILPACLRAKSPFGASGVTPGHGARALLARSVFCRVRAFNIRIQTERGHRVITVDRYRLVLHLSYFAKEIRDTKRTCSTRCTRTGPPKASPQPRSRPSSTPVRSNQRWHARPISCLNPTTFWTTFLSGRTGTEVELYVETLFPPMIPLRVPLPAPASTCKLRNKP